MKESLSLAPCLLYLRFFRIIVHRLQKRFTEFVWNI